MRFVEDWLNRRRRRQLDQINKRIDELKRKGPDFYPAPERKSTIGSREPQKLQEVAHMKSLPLAFVAGILLAIFLLTTIYYRSQGATFEEKYEKTAAEVQDITEQLNTTTLKLLETQDLLQRKEQREANLSEQYTELNKKINDFEQDIKTFNATLQLKIKEFDDLDKEFKENAAYIKRLERCINNDTINEKEDCVE